MHYRSITDRGGFYTSNEVLKEFKNEMNRKKSISSPEEWNQEAARQAEELIRNSDAEAVRLWEESAQRMGELWDAQLSERWKAPEWGTPGSDGKK